MIPMKAGTLSSMMIIHERGNLYLDIWECAINLSSILYMMMIEDLLERKFHKHYNGMLPYCITSVPSEVMPMHHV